MIFTLIKSILKNPKGLRSLLYRFSVDERSKSIVQNKHNLKNGLPQINPKEYFGDYKGEIENYTFTKGNSTIPDILFLSSLAKSFPNCDFLEFGTFRGETMSNVAKIAKECYSLSLSNAEMKAKGQSDDIINMTRMFTKDVPNLTNIEHNSLTYDYSKLEKKFDLIFIDADHSYDAVKSDTRNAFKLLKNDDSIIVWHDANKFFEENNWEVVAGILDGTPEKYINNLYKVNQTLCAIFTKKEVHSFYPSNRRPLNTFSINISAKKNEL